MLASENDYINESSNTMLQLSTEKDSLIQLLLEENERLRARHTGLTAPPYLNIQLLLS